VQKKRIKPENLIKTVAKGEPINQKSSKDHFNCPKQQKSTYF
jgi:hypothetical protein